MMRLRPTCSLSALVTLLLAVLSFWLRPASLRWRERSVSLRPDLRLANAELAAFDLQLTVRDRFDLAFGVQFRVGHEQLPCPGSAVLLQLGQDLGPDQLGRAATSILLSLRRGPLDDSAEGRAARRDADDDRVIRVQRPSIEPDAGCARATAVAATTHQHVSSPPSCFNDVGSGSANEKGRPGRPERPSCNNR